MAGQRLDTVELAQLPGIGGLVLKAATTPRRPPVDAGLPPRRVSVSGVAPDLDRLAAYDELCGFSLRDRVPATWLHVLTFGLQAWLMARSDFPFGLAGILHVSNEMELLRPVLATETLDLSVEARDPRPHAKGVLFDMVGEARVGDELVWRGTSVYLAGAARLPGEPAPTLRLAAPQAPASQQWRLPADLGRRYAKVSGDNNPIHLHPLSARLFGLPRPIIHGMWTHARALAALGGVLPDSYRVRVQFAKPLMLPGRAGFTSERGPEGTRFAVVNREGKPHLVGQLVAQ